MQIPDLAQAQQQQVQVAPFVLELNGAVQVRRQDQMRVLEIIHPSGVIAARLTLDPINAASVARQLSPPAEDAGARVDL